MNNLLELNEEKLMKGEEMVMQNENRAMTISQDCGIYHKDIWEIKGNDLVHLEGKFIPKEEYEELRRML
jgi:hypothetical protein